MQFFSRTESRYMHWWDTLITSTVNNLWYFSWKRKHSAVKQRETICSANDQLFAGIVHECCQEHRQIESKQQTRRKGSKISACPSIFSTKTTTRKKTLPKKSWSIATKWNDLCELVQHELNEVLNVKHSHIVLKLYICYLIWQLASSNKNADDFVFCCFFLLFWTTLFTWCEFGSRVDDLLVLFHIFFKCDTTNWITSFYLYAITISNTFIQQCKLFSLLQINTGINRFWSFLYSVAVTMDLYGIKKKHSFNYTRQ